MAINRSNVLYLDNGTTVDTGTGIDVRRLNSSTVASDASQSVRWTHTQDGTNRTFDPANALVTTVADPEAFQGEGWALRLTEDMTPTDDTNCNAMLNSGTVQIIIDANLNMNGGTNLGGSNTINFRVALIRYNPSTNTGTVFATGRQNQTWDTSALGAENNTYKTTTVNVSVASNVEFAQGEILLLQVGANATTLVDATLGTTNFDLTLRIGGATNTRVDFAANQNIIQACAFTNSLTGNGTVTRGILDISMTKNIQGNGTITYTKAATISKTFNLQGFGSITRDGLLVISVPRNITGLGNITMSRVVTAAKSFNVQGLGTVTRQLSLAMSRTAIGRGTVTLAKQVTASKTFNLTGLGTIIFSKFTIANRSFSLQGKGTILTTGPNASTITIPIDEVPDGGGGGTTIVNRPTYIFDD